MSGLRGSANVFGLELHHRVSLAQPAQLAGAQQPDQPCLAGSDPTRDLDQARAALARALGCADSWVGVASQAEGFGWRATS